MLTCTDVARARLDNCGQRFLLRLRRALYGRDEIRNKVGPALILRLNICPARLCRFFGVGNTVDPACRQHQQAGA